MSPDIDEVRYDVELLPERRREAIAARGKLLLDVSEGRMSAWEAIMMTAVDDRRALRRIRLHQLIMTQPGIGEVRARKIVEQILAILSVPQGSVRPADVTLGYILDARSGGRRLLATLDAFLSFGIIRTEADLDSVWPGFPFSPSPAAKEPR